MIGTTYTPELLAALAKTPHVRRMEVSATPDGKRIASYTTRYTDERGCKTTLFDVGDVELVSTSVDCDADGARFGSILGCDVEKVTVSSHPDGMIVSFVVDLWPEEGLDKRLVVLPAGGSVEITSFFEDNTSDEPWLVIVEPVEHE